MFEIGLLLLGAKRWLTRTLKPLFSSKYFWAALAICTVCILFWRWHVAEVSGAVNTAVKINTANLTAQFEQAKKDAVRMESERAQVIVKQAKGEFDAQIKNINQHAERMLSDARAGTVRLRVPVQSCTEQRRDPSSIEPDPAGITAESRAELSESAGAFFIGEAQRADQQAAQLNSLIDVVERLKSGKLP